MGSFKVLGLSALAFATAACTVGAELEDVDTGSLPAGAGDGLAGTYFDNIDLTAPRFERVDSTIDFAWGRGAPDGLGVDTFSVRWIGFVEPPASGTYEFFVTSDDGARLTVDGVSLVDEWTDHGPRTFSGTRSLEAGRRYAIELEYYENGGGAMVRLEWASAAQPRQVIPRAHLYTTDDLPQTVALDLDDAFVDSARPDRNFDSTVLEIDGDPSVKYALIRPRNLGGIPVGTTVDRATLVVQAFDGGNSWGVHELTGPWSEGSVTFANAPGMTSSRASVPGNTGAHSIDVTGIVQAWVDGAPAHGLALYPTGTNGVDLYSSEHASAALRPQLIVEISSCAGTCPEPEPEPEPEPSEILHIGTTEVWDSNGQDLRIDRPAGSATGDLLVLVLHRTDDDLPLYVDGWTRVAECYKRDNGYECSTEADCTRWHNDDFCAYFGDEGRGGHDLAQSVFVRAVGSGEPSSYTFDLNVDSSGHPGWAILTALRGAATVDPVRDWSFRGCDRDPDSVFPSVFGEAGDMVLLSQSFDDAIAQSKFREPAGMATLGYVSNSDEAGFLFGGILTSSGNTGTMETRGDGGPSCKDALVSLTIRPR